jgi:hypothetical protein
MTISRHHRGPVGRQGEAVIVLDETSSKPIYTQIYTQFREQIISGQYAAGKRLPPIRKLAADLNISRNTVESAYLQLGFDYVCGTNLVAEEMYAKIVSGHGSHVDTIGDYELLRFAMNLEALGVDSLRVGDLERRHQIRIAVFERADGSISSIPSEESILHDGDIVLASVHKDLIPTLAQYMHQ